jgi:hypothetical protein
VLAYIRMVAVKDNRTYRKTARPGIIAALAASLACLALSPALSPALGAEINIAPHQALYSLTLESAKSSSGVVAASGAMFYKWGQACDGWTVEQRFRLRVAYAEEDNVDISSSLVTWESTDGLKYRFNERRMRNGEADEELRGEASLDGPGKGGVAQFTKPETATINLAPGVLFPTAHTLFLIASAQANQQFVARNVFDGSAVENAGEVSAVIGPELKPSGGKAPKPFNSPLLQRPSWQIRLAFFPSDAKSDQTEPDYELGMRLLDNGVTQDMKLDYGDYVIRAKLDEIESLPKPGC